ncbi:oligoendopeptidase F [Pullulanibacillus pueri]|uniref:Oligopeptidase F n=1 Tax=Pullulanibacillus pueri TaxID=1437324 RepID=A0A8J3EP98_9BACL|nr:oligoendopeptidase F [Pullulanibacillus pueri]MBM7684032.1 oligoendopeptidase F [Pullulanibacillus pueri]GGH88510.1 oligoendopeptidase F [Pullulanibacillus pueri]
MAKVKTRLQRNEVPEKSTWDLTALFENYEAWEIEVAAVRKDLHHVTQFKGKLGEGARTLLACLKAQEAFLQRVIRVSTYASLRQAADGSDPVNQADGARIADLLSHVNASLAFIKSEVLALPTETIKAYIEQEEGLKLFEKHLTELIETKPHILAPETEEALASLGAVFDAPYMIYERGKSSDMQFDSIVDEKGEELPMSFALYEDFYEESPNTELRRKAFASFVRTLKQYKNTFGATFATEVNKQVTEARLRRYQSATEMMLEPQQVTLEMYENQLNIIQEELAPHMRRYAQLKQRVLGLDDMFFCDLKAPLDPEFNPETTYEEASEVILEALQVMGPEYSGMVKTALTERWVDLADNVGKSTGAFCSSPYGVHPYILITWSDSMRSAFTLAHELGHAGHFFLAGKHQTLTNTRPSMYFIEAPSTMNEMLLGRHLLSKTTDKRMRRWVVLQLLGTYYHNFVTHLLEGELQRRIFTLAEAGTPITATTLTTQKTDILQSFWGDTVTIDEGAGLTWMRQPHYYMGLYPYTYSAGLTVSTAASQMILEEGAPAVERWLDVLKSGGTLKPLDLIQKAGLDMSKPEAIRKAVAYVGTLIDELEASYNE